METPSPDRLALARKRLLSVLKATVVSLARTLEQKISDAGPSQMRIDPHILTTARTQLISEGLIKQLKRHGVPWYHLTAMPQRSVKARLAVLQPIHAALQSGDLSKRIGQALEITVYRALIAQTRITTLGAYLDLQAHDDATLYQKEEPPSALSGRRSKGRLDFLLLTHDHGIAAGLEVKNVREWLYPDRDEIKELLAKCTDLNAVPVLIGRRIPFVTFRLLNTCGVIIHQTYNQRFPSADHVLADQARQKDLLGFHDIRLGNQPDARLTRFVNDHLPKLISQARPTFDRFVDLLHAYGHGRMPYYEFAARVRRRNEGKNEDSDWDTEDHSY